MKVQLLNGAVNADAGHEPALQLDVNKWLADNPNAEVVSITINIVPSDTPQFSDPKLARFAGKLPIQGLAVILYK